MHIGLAAYSLARQHGKLNDKLKIGLVTQANHGCLILSIFSIKNSKYLHLNGNCALSFSTSSKYDTFRIQSILMAYVGNSIIFKDIIPLNVLH